MEKTRTKFRSSKVVRKLEPLHIPENSFNEKFDNNLNEAVEQIHNDEKRTEQDNISDAVTVKGRKKSEEFERVNGNPSEENMASIGNLEPELRAPYEFIGVSSPSFRTIILPHFSFKTITFVLSVVMLVMFLAIFVTHQIRPQTTTSWGCLLFETQNKFYPRLRLEYQFWRIPVSGLFHSNFTHLILNLIGLQLYGYFMEWYLGKWKFTGLLILTIVNSHFMSCLTNMRTVSTTVSGILYSILAIKILFFIKYHSKKYALYGLLGLIFGINLVVLFVGSNVDIGGHLGGLLTGLIYGGIFYSDKGQVGTKRTIKFCLVGLMVLFVIGLIGAAFGMKMGDIEEVNSLINNVC